VKGWFADETGQTVALIKPQFEAGRKAAAVHAGVIKDKAVHRKVLRDTLDEAQRLGFWPVGLIASPIKGPKGNVEFLVDLRLAEPNRKPDVSAMIAGALQQLPD
jgi:23S rRNA (cytidine1920-2'-O)/16S rRNA (cytidine1409-2'-O)-methyltransferase